MNLFCFSEIFCYEEVFNVVNVKGREPGAVILHKRSAAQVALRALLAVLLLALTALAAPSADLGSARELYQRTEYREVVRLLDTGHDQDNEAPSYALIGKAYYMMGDYRNATHALEKAIERDPKNSDYFDWLGKIYGRRAETSGLLTAWSYARKTGQNFERAVELDPTNLEAIDDVFEFSMNAPGFVGGGIEKAAAVAEKSRNVDPAKYHSFQARLADKKKDFATEERHLQLALELAPTHVGRILDMAEFLARRGKYEESERMFEHAQKIAPDNAEMKFERAETYIRSGRNREAAKRLLKQYIESSLTPDDPPRSEAERLLKQCQGLG